MALRLTGHWAGRRYMAGRHCRECSQHHGKVKCHAWLDSLQAMYEHPFNIQLWQYTAIKATLKFMLPRHKHNHPSDLDGKAY